MDDLISRQAAIYAISHAQVNFNVESEIDFTNHKREVHEIVVGVLDAQEKALNELASVQSEQRWIPVSERLPKEETDVLICNADGNIEISSGSYSTELKNEFIWWYTRWGFGEVVAWMPLPEPYKAERR